MTKFPPKASLSGALPSVFNPKFIKILTQCIFTLLQVNSFVLHICIHNKREHIACKVSLIRTYIKFISKGMYRLQLVGDKSSTIERISSAYLKPYKLQHGCIDTSARHVYIYICKQYRSYRDFQYRNNGSIATAKNSKQEDPQQCQDTYELDKHEAADEDDDFHSTALKEQLYSSNLLCLYMEDWCMVIAV